MCVHVYEYMCFAVIISAAPRPRLARLPLALVSGRGRSAALASPIVASQVNDFWSYARDSGVCLQEQLPTGLRRPLSWLLPQPAGISSECDDCS